MGRHYGPNTAHWDHEPEPLVGRGVLTAPPKAGGVRVARRHAEDRRALPLLVRAGDTIRNEVKKMGSEKFQFRPFPIFLTKFF